MSKANDGSRMGALREKIKWAVQNLNKIHENQGFITDREKQAAQEAYEKIERFIDYLEENNVGE